MGVRMNIEMTPYYVIFGDSLSRIYHHATSPDLTLCGLSPNKYFDQFTPTKPKDRRLCKNCEWVAALPKNLRAWGSVA